MSIRHFSTCMLFALFIFATLLIPACNKGDQGSSGSPPSASSTSGAPTAAPAPQPKAPELTVAADALSAEYKADEKAADAKYKGKYIEVKGIVGNPGSPGAEKNFFVVAAASNPAMFAFGPFFRCFVTDADALRCDLLGQTQKITFRGTCAGKTPGEGGTELDFTDCSITKTSPDPAPTYTAEQLTKAYAADPKGSSDKYHWQVKGNHVIITGVVQKLDPDNYEVWLDGWKSPAGQSIDLHCRLSSVFWAEAAKHSVGQPIQIKAECDDFKGTYLSAVFGIPLPPTPPGPVAVDPEYAAPADVSPKLTLADPKGDAYAACFGAAGKTILTGTMDGPVIVWEADSGKSLGATTGRDSYVNLILSPDQKTVAASGQFDTIKLLDPATGKETRSLSGHTGSGGTLLGIEALAWSPDGTKLASAKGLEIKIWDVASGKELVTFTAPAKLENVLCLAFSPDGQTIAGGGDSGGMATDGTLCIWNATGGQPTATIPMSGGNLHWVCFADGKTLIAPEGFSGAVVLDIATGKPLRHFNTNFETLTCAAISPDGKRLAAGGSSKEGVHLWDIATSKEMANFKGLTDGAKKVSFSPDGTLLIAACQKTTLIWQLPP